MVPKCPKCFFSLAATTSLAGQKIGARFYEQIKFPMDSRFTPNLFLVKWDDLPHQIDCFFVSGFKLIRCLFLGLRICLSAVKLTDVLDCRVPSYLAARSLGSVV